MAGGIDQNEGAQDARLGKWQGNQRLLQGQSNVPHSVGRQFCGIFFGQGVDVQAVHHALHFGLDPAVAMQSPVKSAGHQGFVVHPGDGSLNLSCAFKA